MSVASFCDSAEEHYDDVERDWPRNARAMRTFFDVEYSQVSKHCALDLVLLFSHLSAAEYRPFSPFEDLPSKSIFHEPVVLL